MKKGHKLSEETRKRMSEAKKGKTPKNIKLFIEARKKYIPSEEQNKKRSEDYKAKGIKPPSRKGQEAWNKGKTGIYSQETKDKIAKSVSDYLKEHPLVYTEEARKKIGDAHRAEKSTFWKGGVSKENRTERQIFCSSPEYKKWRRDIFERDEFICQKCTIKGGKLRAHHIKRYIDYPDLRLDLCNGVTLCDDCDNKFVLHREKQWESYFIDNLKSRGFIL